MSRDSWATPMPVYLAMDAEFDFAADLAADERNAKHPYFLTEADDALSDITPYMLELSVLAGRFAWCNPPYSAIGPWIELAITLQRRGIGTVLLVMADTSVGWYWRALQHCNEVREIVAGRLAFINADTGLPVSGNNKGSLLLVFDPFGRPGNPRRTHVERDVLMARGLALMTEPERLFPLSPELTPLSPELAPVYTELAEEDTEATPCAAG